IGPVIAWAMGQRVIAKIDLSKAFHAVPLVEHKRPYYSFLDPEGNCYCYARMPMGAKTAPKHFANVMNLVLGQLATEDQVNVRSYQDDIVIAANSREELDIRYEKVSEHLRRCGFKINKDKSSKAESLDVLGYRFEKKKVTIPLKKERSIRSALWSKDMKQVIRATHQLGYYKLILTPAQRDSAAKLRQILLKVGHFTQVARDLRTALDVKWECPKEIPWSAKRIEIY
ncbi:RNA-directed DNA polymerase, partial [Gregarina niphandrodes]